MFSFVLFSWDQWISFGKNCHSSRNSRQILHLSYLWTFLNYGSYRERVRVTLGSFSVQYRCNQRGKTFQIFSLFPCISAADFFIGSKWFVCGFVSFLSALEHLVMVNRQNQQSATHIHNIHSLRPIAITSPSISNVCSNWQIVEKLLKHTWIKLNLKSVCICVYVWYKYNTEDLIFQEPPKIVAKMDLSMAIRIHFVENYRDIIMNKLKKSWIWLNSRQFLVGLINSVWTKSCAMLRKVFKDWYYWCVSCWIVAHCLHSPSFSFFVFLFFFSCFAWLSSI